MPEGLKLKWLDCNEYWQGCATAKTQWQYQYTKTKIWILHVLGIYWEWVYLSKCVQESLLILLNWKQLKSSSIGNCLKTVHICILDGIMTLENYCYNIQ